MHAPLLALLLTTVPARGAAQELVFDVATASNLRYRRLQVEVERLGERTVVPLADDGEQPGDIAWDGVYTGSLRGPYARYVNLKLIGETLEGVQEPLFAGVVRTDDQRVATVGWRLLDRPEGVTALRVPVAYPGSVGDVLLSLPLVSAFGWGALCLLYVGLLVRKSER